MSDEISIQFTRFSAFHSPLIADASTIASCQTLGCRTPHVEITRAAFEATLDVFRHAGLITRRHRYEDVVAPPPDAA